MQFIFQSRDSSLSGIRIDAKECHLSVLVQKLHDMCAKSSACPWQCTSIDRPEVGTQYIVFDPAFRYVEDGLVYLEAENTTSVTFGGQIVQISVAKAGFIPPAQKTTHSRIRIRYANTQLSCISLVVYVGIEAMQVPPHALKASRLYPIPPTPRISPMATQQLVHLGSGIYDRILHEAKLALIKGRNETEINERYDIPGYTDRRHEMQEDWEKVDEQDIALSRYAAKQECMTSIFNPLGSREILAALCNTAYLQDDITRLQDLVDGMEKDVDVLQSRNMVT